MSKYSILLAIIGLVSVPTKAWDGKLIQVSKSNGNAHGVMVRYYDHDEINSAKKMKAILTRDGFETTYIGDIPVDHCCVKTVDGVIYGAHIPHLGKHDPDVVCKDGPFDGLDHWHKKDDHRHSAISWAYHKGPTMRDCFGDVKVHLVCRQHQKSNVEPWLKEVAQGYQEAWRMCKKDFPQFSYKAIDCSGPTSITALDHFTHFLAKEKMALGLMGLSLLTVGLSSH